MANMAGWSQDKDRGAVVGVITQVTNAVRGRQTINPRTVLGFYATVLGILFAGTVGTVGVLASTGVETGMIPWLLGFSGLLLLLVLAGVFVVSLVDPSKLMLTQVTGSEYAHIQQQLILGDSSRGDRVETLPVLESVSITDSMGTVLPEASVVVEQSSHGRELTDNKKAKESSR